MNSILPSHISDAKSRLQGIVTKTPLMEANFWSALTGAQNIFFKCEQFQYGGAFKYRGASNAVLQLPPEAKECGVITHSSGNHAAALALAARRQGIPSTIIMPENAPNIKIRNVQQAGGSIIFCKPTLADREATLASFMENTKPPYFIPPYNHPDIIAGQATALLEVFDEGYKPDYVIVPVGGGGLASGTTLAAKYFSPSTVVLGAEPEQADDAFLSLQTGILQSATPNTIADGLRTSLGNHTFNILHSNSVPILRVSEIHIICAMRCMWEYSKLLIEPSSAVAVAALLAYPALWRNKQVCVILSGGNVDVTMLPWQKKTP